MQTVPAFPQYITAAPGNGQVTLSWYSPANTGGLNISGYVVNYGTTASLRYTTLGCTTSSESGLSCTVSGLTNGTPYTFTFLASNGVAAGPKAFLSSVTPGSVLTANPSNLALSSGGAARTITLTNNSTNPETLNVISAPSLPSGTSTNACADGMTLNAGGSCAITITPGNTVSSGAGSLCTTGIAPTPSAITVNGTSDTVSINIYVLDLGCQYQSGYLFSIDDTTPRTSSIGGKVLTLSNQTGSALDWSTTTNNIWGIDDASTIATPHPNSSSGQGASLSTGQLNCNAVNDGPCATNNVFFYSNLSGNTAVYAVNSCKGNISGYTDWHLPSVCDLGPFGSTGLSVGSYPYLSTSQTCAAGTNIQNTLINIGIVTNYTASGYWSSTQRSDNTSSIFNVWYQSTARSQGPVNMDGAYNTVRCSRVLTL